MARKMLVVAEWDDEAALWVATSDDIPGLVTEAATLDDLLARVLAVGPELLEDNQHLIDRTAFSEALDLHVLSPLQRQRA